MAGRDFVQGARVDAHLVARLVGLDARAIHLVLEGCFPEIGQRLFDILRGLREHRLHWTEELHVVQVECGDAVFRDAAGDGRDIAGHHDGTADVCRREAVRFGEPVGHDAFERALADFAGEQSGEKLLLVGVGAGEERRQQGPAPLRRSAPAKRLYFRERPIDFEETQGRSGSGFAAHAAQGCIADADPALACAAGEKRRGHLGFVGRQAVE
jgi:hypothetical protein